MSERPPHDLATRAAPHARALGVACVLALAGCQASTASLELDSARAPTTSTRSSPLEGHRFGGWLEVESDSVARPALEQACRLEQAGASEDAVAVLSRALVLHPASAALFAARGALCFSLGFPRAGAGDFERAVYLAPECAESWLALGHAYEKLALSHQAQQAFERAGSLALK